jgi:hypothetical protein
MKKLVIILGLTMFFNGLFSSDNMMSNEITSYLKAELTKAKKTITVPYIGTFPGIRELNNKTTFDIVLSYYYEICKDLYISNGKNTKKRMKSIRKMFKSPRKMIKKDVNVALRKQKVEKAARTEKLKQDKITKEKEINEEKIALEKKKNQALEQICSGIISGETLRYEGDISPVYYFKIKRHLTKMKYGAKPVPENNPLKEKRVREENNKIVTATEKYFKIFEKNLLISGMVISDKLEIKLKIKKKFIKYLNNKVLNNSEIKRMKSIIIKKVGSFDKNNPEHAGLIQHVDLNPIMKI